LTLLDFVLKEDFADFAPKIAIKGDCSGLSSFDIPI
jgi:hypothetical protein